MTVEVHSVLDERYALDELIARGGMADVFRGTDQVLLRPVAVKVLREFSEPAQRDRFIAEARTLASLNHPGLVTLLDAGIMIDRPYLVLELATGPTLSACIAEGRMDSDRVSSIGRQLAEALAYAHDQGVVHRDVKPSNVLVSEDDRVLLADFGIAQLAGAAEHHTKPGETIGSPAYLAPEQVAGETIGPAVDVFSLGLVLLEALTGTRAYTGAPIEAAVARLHAAPTIPSYLDPRWRTLLARMTHRDASERPSAGEVAEELSVSFAPDVPSAEAGPEVDTGALELTAETPAVAAGATDPRGEDDADVADDRAHDLAFPVRRSRVRVLGIAALLVLAGVVAFLALGFWNGSAEEDPPPEVPAGVPSRLQDPLEDLHVAIEGHHP